MITSYHSCVYIYIIVHVASEYYNYGMYRNRSCIVMLNPGPKLEDNVARLTNDTKKKKF